MRVWDLDPVVLCDQHLLGQHLEIHTMYSVIINGYKGYSRHPETMRWRNHLTLLKDRHDATAAEMVKRGMNHRSPLLDHDYQEENYADPLTRLDTPQEQAYILMYQRDCPCLLVPMNKIYNYFI